MIEIGGLVLLFETASESKDNDYQVYKKSIFFSLYVNFSPNGTIKFLNKPKNHIISGLYSNALNITLTSTFPAPPILQTLL